MLALNLDFYLRCMQKRGLAFAAASCRLHLLFFIYSSVPFAVVLLHRLLLRPAEDSEWLPIRRIHTRKRDSFQGIPEVTAEVMPAALADWPVRVASGRG